MFLQLRSCTRFLFTSQGTGIRAWHHLSQTPSRIVSPLLRNGGPKQQISPIRWKNTIPDKAEKVKFRKEDVKRLFRFAKGEGYVILGRQWITLNLEHFN